MRRVFNICIWACALVLASCVSDTNVKDADNTPAADKGVLKLNVATRATEGQTQRDYILSIYKNDADKQKCISEAKSVLRDGGKIFFAFISNDFVFLTEFGYDVNYFSNGDYDKETFKLNDFPFVFHTVGAARNLLADGGINVLHEVASDGASELLAAKINEMSDEDYAQYLRYHFYICEKPELLGMTNHLLFVGEKK